MTVQTWKLISQYKQSHFPFMNVLKEQFIQNTKYLGFLGLQWRVKLDAILCFPWLLFCVSPATAVVQENAATPFCCEALEMCWGLHLTFNRHGAEQIRTEFSCLGELFLSQREQSKKIWENRSRKNYSAPVGPLLCTCLSSPASVLFCRPVVHVCVPPSGGVYVRV